MLNFSFLIFLILPLFGCSTNLSIGGQKHQFNVTPKNVVWFQIAGLSDSHLPLISFENSLEDRNFFKGGYLHRKNLELLLFQKFGQSHLKRLTLRFWGLGTYKIFVVIFPLMISRIFFKKIKKERESWRLELVKTIPLLN